VPVLKSFAGGLFGTTWGSQPAEVLALHGWRRTHADFDPVFIPAEFSDAHGAVGLDLFGFGATPAPPEPWDSAVYAEHLLPLFAEPQLATRVTVVGHSFGGRVAVRLARLQPDRIDRLVLTGVPLLDPPGPRPTSPLGFRVGRRLHRLGLVGDGRMERLRQQYGSADYRAARGVMRDVLVTTLAEQYADDMAAVGCPVDLVWGELDTEVPLEVAERAGQLFPKATLRVLPGIGHLTPTEAPDQLRRVVLAGLTPSDSGSA
jgi:pimeloyl-ACP methyl ester carboxylesterase